MDAVNPSPSPPKRRRMAFIELTYLAQQWQPTEDPPLFAFWMASSEVDQKFLGHFAKKTSLENNYLSSFLYRILGLSVILAEKLLRARKAKRLDPSRDAKARQLIHHILWLAREGLIMVEQYVLPMVENSRELKVLSYKLRASFYHIFVLFHNEPPVNSRIARSRSGSVTSGAYSLFPDPLSPKGPSITRTGQKGTRESVKSPTRTQRSPAISLGGAVGGSTTARTPPGLSLPAPLLTSTYGIAGTGQSSGGSANATFLLPLIDYTPHATAAFKAADALAEQLLPGSHPVRLSVKVEYVAYVYDCLKEYDISRRMAKAAIRQVYEAQEGMDDESFEDAAEMVGMLGKMLKRGLGSNSQGMSNSGSGTGSGGLAQNGVRTNSNIDVSSKTGPRSDDTISQQPTTWV